jgi:hypothetical protein
MSLFIDSDAIGTGPLTTRVYFRLEGGVLLLWTLEREVAVDELSARDVDEICHLLNLDWLARHRQFALVHHARVKGA